MDLPFIEKKVLEHFVKKVEHTYIGDVLKENHLL
jgi:oleate hydratase